MNLFTKGQIVAGFVPLDLQTARDGDWVKLYDWGDLNIIFFAGTGTDGEDPTITLQQATDNAGAGAKALNFTTIYRKQGADVLAVPQFETITQAAANTYTNTDGHLQKIWGLYVDRDELDLDGGFKYVRLRCSDVGSNAQLGCVLYVLNRFLGEPPSAL